MGGSKSTSTSSSSSGSAQAWATPIATNAAQQVQGVYNANQGKAQTATNSLYGLGSNLLTKFNGGNPNVNAASAYNSDVLSGKYLNGNPYLQSQIDQSNRDITNNVSSQFAAAGRYGSGAYADLLSRNMADAENNLRYTDYNNQQARMDAAAAQAPALAQAGYVGLPEILQTMTTAGALPYAGTNAYTSALGTLFNGGTSTGQQTQSTSGLGSLMQGLGSIGSAVGSMGQAGIFSDRRLKTEIERVDELPDGLGVYEWRYVWGGERHRGVMADEVARLRPWALGPQVAGYATVNYGAL